MQEISCAVYLPTRGKQMFIKHWILLVFFTPVILVDSKDISRVKLERQCQCNFKKFLVVYLNILQILMKQHGGSGRWELADKVLADMVILVCYVMAHVCVTVRRKEEIYTQFYSHYYLFEFIPAKRVFTVREPRN